MAEVMQEEEQRMEVRFKAKETKEVMSDRTLFLSRVKVIGNFDIYSFTNHEMTLDD